MAYQSNSTCSAVQCSAVQCPGTILMIEKRRARKNGLLSGLRDSGVYPEFYCTLWIYGYMDIEDERRKSRRIVWSTVCPYTHD